MNTLQSIFNDIVFKRIHFDGAAMNTQRAKLIFQDCGISVSEWARQNGFSSTLVYQVLEGKRKCLRGQSHQIALALGIKQGKNLNVEDLNRCLIEPR